MKRTPMKPGKKPLARTAFKRPATDSTGILRVQAKDRTVKARKAMKSSRPKMTPIRASARGQECTLRFPGICNYRTDTTVLCHENGAGMGMKGRDDGGAYGCCDCHRVLDGHAPRPAGFTREAMLARFVQANLLTRAILKQAKLID